MAVQRRPSAQQVAVSWLKSLDDLTGVDVATTLALESSWSGQDFVSVGPALGGIPSPYLVTRVPVVQIDCWSKAPNSSRPAWNRAGMTAEAIRDACYGSSQYGIFDIPGSFMSVNLHQVSPVTEPRRMQGDAAAIARYSLALEFRYTPVSLVIT